MSAASWLLMALGVLALVDAAVTMVWQEPFTALYASVQQEQLGGALAHLDAAPPNEIVAQRLALLHREDARISLLASELERSAPEGSAVGRIQIPRIGISFAVVKGTGTADLEKGPGIYSRSVYPQSRFPGTGGVTPIAGHRTTFLAPFRHVDELRPGNRITITTPYARFEYTVQRTRIVNPEDVAAVLHPGGSTRLVLSACNPPFSAAQRMLIYASLTSKSPLGAARAYVQGIVARSYPSSRLGSAIGLPNGGLQTRL
ncbi:MAG: class E sortase [Solirubrobacteraceae bacterium]